MLTLEVIDYKGQAPVEPVAVMFDKIGGTIGRGDSNALVLPDEDLLISRMHARISFRAGRYFVEDHGSSTAVSVNGHSLGRGVDAPLSHGDEVRIGGYRLRVDLQSGRGAPALSVSQTIVARVRATPNASSAAHAAALGETRDMMLATQRISREEMISRDPLRAFFEGAGVAEAHYAQNASPQTMHRLGETLRELLQAVLDLLDTRSEIERTWRPEAPGTAAGGANPLKHATSAAAALSYLLAPPRDMAPPAQAVQGACNELRAHQLAVAAAANAALVALLQRLSPAQIEQQLLGKGMIGSLLPSNRKARLWDQFSDSYDDLAQAAQADFQALIGREFIRAYETHLRRLAQGDAGPGR